MQCYQYKSKGQSWQSCSVEMKIFPFRLAWENSQHFTMPPKVSPWNDVWETSTEIPYWWWITTLDLGSASDFTSSMTNQKHYQDLGCDASSVWNFCIRFSDIISCVAKGGKVWGLISESPEERAVIQQVPSVGMVWIFSGTTQYYDLQLQCGISKCFIWWMLVHMVAEVYTCKYQYL